MLAREMQADIQIKSRYQHCEHVCPTPFRPPLQPENAPELHASLTHDASSNKLYFTQHFPTFISFIPIQTLVLESLLNTMLLL